MSTQSTYCVYLAARMSPDYLEQFIRRDEATQWSISFIVAMQAPLIDALFEHTSGYRYYIHRIPFEDFDLLDAFGVPREDEDHVRNSVSIVKPQAIRSNNKIKRIDSRGNLSWEDL